MICQNCKSLYWKILYQMFFGNCFLNLKTSPLCYRPKIKSTSNIIEDPLLFCSLVPLILILCNVESIIIHKMFRNTCWLFLAVDILCYFNLIRCWNLTLFFLHNIVNTGFNFSGYYIHRHTGVVFIIGRMFPYFNLEHTFIGFIKYGYYFLEVTVEVY